MHVPAARRTNPLPTTRGYAVEPAPMSGTGPPVPGRAVRVGTVSMPREPPMPLRSAVCEQFREQAHPDSSASTSLLYYLRMNATIPRREEPIDDVVTLAVEVLRILADSTRLRIATLLIDDELSVSDLAGAVKRPVPGVSQHLAKMRLAHLVATRKQGTTVLYRIDDEHIRQLVLDTTRHVEHLLSDRPAHHEPRSHA